MTDHSGFIPGRNVCVPQSGDAALIRDALKYWQVQDVEATLSTYSEGVVYHLYTFQDAPPRFATLTGKDAVRSALYDILTQFDYLFYASDLLELRDGIARVQSRFVLRHRYSRETLSGSKRQFVEIGGGLITRIDEYHDVALVEAFMKMTQCRFD